ncbi:MAG: hydroxyacid dehydrogenase, partial [Vallitaleaceae bacterium]|nr:hydroxyacid dehydrogenase [Vallitaleaceae bacterium]
MKLVILDANSLGGQLDLSVFENFGELMVYGFTSPEEVAMRIQDAEVIITNKVTLGEHNLSEAKELKLICITGTGTNNVDKVYTLSRGIIVSNVVNYSTENVVQHTFALLLYLLEHLPFYDEYVTSGGYVEDKTYGHFKQSYHELNGKIWGIIGLGNIGKRVAQVAEAFGCKVQYYSTSGKNVD